MWVFGVFVREKRIAEVLITSTVGPGHHMKNENILKCSEPLWGYSQNFILGKRGHRGSGCDSAGRALASHA